MTEEQALKILNSETENISDVQVALKVARDALEEIQQYREIGTVEAITTHLDMLKAYETIGTIKELQALKEKSVAKKPLFIKRSVTQFYACPHCSTNEHYQWIYPKVKYCDVCGGWLDWE